MPERKNNPAEQAAKRLGSTVRGKRTQRLSPPAQSMLREAEPEVFNAYQEGLQGKE